LETKVRIIGAVVGVIALIMVTALGSIPAAHASTFGFELNGTYSILSNGEWAKSNDSFHKEPVVRAIWKISSTCDSPSACTGQVDSDQGWTAPLKFSADSWIVKRDLPNWAPCETGGAVTGHERFSFYGVDDKGQSTGSTELLAGNDTTRTDSGSCGKSLPLNIVIPMRLQRLS
jgi:hypothetical protein